MEYKPFHCFYECKILDVIQHDLLNCLNLKLIKVIIILIIITFSTILHINLKLISNFD